MEAAMVKAYSYIRSLRVRAGRQVPLSESRHETRQPMTAIVDGDGENEEYRAACELAQQVGIDLRDG